MNHTFWFSSAGSGQGQFTKPLGEHGGTYALTRTTSFSSVISVYRPCSFSFMSFMRSILRYTPQRLGQGEVKEVKERRGKHLTLF